MQFVNIHGQPIAAGSLGGGHVAAKKSKATPDSYHKGWKVVGFSPEQLAEARAKYVSTDGKPFDEVTFMRTNKPVRASKKPYVIHDAAELFKAMLERQGWKVVQVVPIAKGKAE
ncbi:hypothetical protein [Piscinibacter gummiphilus]|uniref:Uncharacterized protein n=1 Tax=Piscinibacter gummiphilus TaxID=946333 RepID=A0ABZ0CNS0_9BURK|nr:hypothetical protein [Piscinibacter gummiphilus]WOB06534.1 hypothetical protein RXV79_16550 [Piscinibacter gummiphilus]